VLAAETSAYQLDRYRYLLRLPLSFFRNFSELSQDFPQLIALSFFPGRTATNKTLEVAAILWERPATLQPKGEQSMNQIEKEIVRLEEELTQTESRLDVGALERIYADDIMVTAPIGICVDKPAVMTEIRLAAAKAAIGKYDKDDLKVRAYGDTAAVSSYRMSTEATFEGTEIKRQLCITNVWMKRSGNWQVVARHTASLPNDTPPVAERAARS
jgi:ketosteroid isomerase-like protein